MKLKKINNRDLPWKPFGIRMTMAEWENLATTFIQADLDRRLGVKKDTNDA